ncbi:glycosyltransferase [Parabacteroides distasonis]|nr:glycosyltransferase [Parabacteroides distasonis]
MKICIFTSSIDKSDGGPARSVPILTKGIAANNCDVTLMARETEQMNDHMIEGSKVKLVKYNKSYTTKTLERILLEGNYDLVHAQGIWLPIYNKMAMILRKHGIPYVMTPRGALEPWCLEQKKWKKKIAMWLYQKKDLQKAAAILTTADMEAQHLRELGIKTPLAVIPNGIDVSEYQCRPADCLSSVKKQIVFLSRIHQKKGIEILINVWENLRIDFPDWNVVIAGNGEESYIEQLKNVISSKGLSDVVEIIPPVFGEAKHKLYMESSLFVLPTYSENFGMVVAEALACGVPVVTTNGTPWQELNDENIGWCVDLSEQNIENAIRDALSLPAEVLFAMGQRGSMHINENYLYTSVAKKNIELYKWILEGGERPEFMYNG